jgi:uncharacterized membrane protein
MSCCETNKNTWHSYISITVAVNVTNDGGADNVSIHKNVSATRVSTLARTPHTTTAGDTLAGLVGMVLVTSGRRPGEVLRMRLPPLNPQSVCQYCVFAPELVRRIRIVPAHLRLIIAVITEQPATQRLEQTLAVGVEWGVVTELDFGRFGCSNQLWFLFRKDKRRMILI